MNPTQSERVEKEIRNFLDSIEGMEIDSVTVAAAIAAIVKDAEKEWWS